MKKLLFSSLIMIVFSLNSFGQATNYNPGDVVADFTVTDIYGVTHNLYDYLNDGKYVMIDFFFDTCGPCQGYQPTYNEFHDKYGCNAEDVVCITMNNGSDSDAEVIAYENTYGGSFRHAPAISADGNAAAVDTDFGVQAYPTTVVINPDKTLLVNDIWPAPNVAALEAPYPAGAITPAQCSASGVSLEENSVANFSVFPNPASDKITIDLDEVTGELFTVKMINVVGQKVASYSISKNSSSIDVSDLSSGQYILQLSNEDGYKNQQLISIQ